MSCVSVLKRLAAASKVNSSTGLRHTGHGASEICRKDIAFTSSLLKIMPFMIDLAWEIETILYKGVRVKAIPFTHSPDTCYGNG